MYVCTVYTYVSNIYKLLLQFLVVSDISLTGGPAVQRIRLIDELDQVPCTVFMVPCLQQHVSIGILI